MAVRIFKVSSTRIICRCSSISPRPVPGSGSLKDGVSIYQVAHMSVWEKDKKAGYRKPIEVPKSKMVKDGVKTIGSEMGMWWDETKEKFACDQNVFDIRHGDYEYVWKLHDKKSVADWIITTDKDNNEGFSQANFTFTKNNTGLFHGHLSQQVPKDGIVKRTGYCNIRSPTKMVRT